MEFYSAFMKDSKYILVLAIAAQSLSGGVYEFLFGHEENKTEQIEKKVDPRPETVCEEDCTDLEAKKTNEDPELDEQEHSGQLQFAKSPEHFVEPPKSNSLLAVEFQEPKRTDPLEMVLELAAPREDVEPQPKEEDILAELETTPVPLEVLPDIQVVLQEEPKISPPAQVAIPKKEVPKQKPHTKSTIHLFDKELLGEENNPIKLNHQQVVADKSLSVPHPIEIQNHATFHVGQGKNLAFTGSCTGAGSIKKTGGGRITLHDFSGFSGPTHVEEGRLEIVGSFPEKSLLHIHKKASVLFTGNTCDKTVDFLYGEGELHINDSELIISNGGHFLGKILGKQGLTKKGPCTLILSGKNTYGGGTYIYEGIVQVEKDTSLGCANAPIFIQDSTLAVTGSTHIDRPTLISNRATIDIFEGKQVHFDGEITGERGVLQKDGEGTLILNHENTYQGGTILKAGSLKVSNSKNLGPGTITFDGGKLLYSDEDFVFPQGAQFNVPHTFDLDEEKTLSFIGGLNGKGSIQKVGAGTLQFFGYGEYTGTITVQNGQLISDCHSLKGTVVNHSAVHFIENTNLELSAHLKGPGLWIKSGVGQVTLTGKNNIESPFLVQEGSIKGCCNNLSHTLFNRSSVEFCQDEDGIYTGFIMGEGEVVKTGEGRLEIKTKQGYEGQTIVKEGELKLNGFVRDVRIENDGLLTGAGILRDLENLGTVHPGNSIDTLTVLGEYTQPATGTLMIDLSPEGESDLVNVTGTANIDGTLKINLEHGYYDSGSTYTFLTAANVNGTFHTLTSDFEGLSLIYDPTTIQITLSVPLTSLPVPIANLRGNSRRMADYLYANNFTASNGDLANALQELLNLQAYVFPLGLMKVSPIIYASIPLVNLQNDVRMADVLTHEFKEICACRYGNPYKYKRKAIFRRAKGRKARVEKHKNCVKDREKGLWIEPMAFYYNQSTDEGRLTDEGIPAFTAYTFGVGGGWSQLVINNKWTYNIGAGYTRSYMYFSEGLGWGDWDAVYFSPSMGYLGKKWFANLQYLSSFNFYKIRRNIRYALIDRKAVTHYKSFDFLVRLDSGARFLVKQNFYIQPEGEFNYVCVYQEGFSESGAAGLDLKINSRAANFLRPKVTVRFIEEFFFRRGCLSPNIYLGYVADIPLSQKEITSRFIVESTARKRVSLFGPHATTNQAVVGLEIPYQSYKNLTVKGGYEANFLSRSQIHQITVRVQWDF